MIYVKWKNNFFNGSMKGESLKNCVKTIRFTQNNDMYLSKSSHIKIIKAFGFGWEKSNESGAEFVTYNQFKFKIMYYKNNLFYLQEI